MPFKPVVLKGRLLGQMRPLLARIDISSISNPNIYKAMATHSSTLACKISWTEKPGGLQYMGSLGVRHNRETSLSVFTFMHWRKKWQPTPIFLPGESQGRGSRTRLKRLSSSSSSSSSNHWKVKGLTFCNHVDCTPLGSCP